MRSESLRERAFEAGITARAYLRGHCALGFAARACLRGHCALEITAQACSVATVHSRFGPWPSRQFGRRSASHVEITVQKCCSATLCSVSLCSALLARAFMLGYPLVYIYSIRFAKPGGRFWLIRFVLAYFRFPVSTIYLIIFHYPKGYAHCRRPLFRSVGKVYLKLSLFSCIGLRHLFTNICYIWVPFW